MTNSKNYLELDDYEVEVLDRLVRIETRLAKMMEALGLDPKTGKRESKPRTNRTLNDR